jgi:membrane protein DedA with SNARE-associated domain
MFDISVAELLNEAGQHPAVQAGAIVIGTFILEDAATVLAAMEVETGKTSLALALASLYVGIVLGDFGLYGLGKLAALFPWARRWVPPQKVQRGKAWVETHVFKVVFVSRFLPGARLPTYTLCGFLGADFRRFALAAVVATLIWTSLLFGISLHIGKLLVENLGTWRWVGAAGFALTLVIMGRLAARIQAEVSR